MFLQPTNSVVIANFPNPMPVSGTVAVSSVGGTVTVSGTATVSGTVAVSNFPATQPVSGTVTVTQGTSPWVVNDPGLPDALGQAAAAGSTSVVLASDQPAVPVSGTFWQATQPISAASLPLPANASIETGGHLQRIEELLSALITEARIHSDVLTDGLNVYKKDLDALRSDPTYNWPLVA